MYCVSRALQGSCVSSKQRRPSQSPSLAGPHPQVSCYLQVAMQDTVGRHGQLQSLRANLTHAQVPSGKPGSSTQCQRQDARQGTPAGTSKAPCLLPSLLVRCAGTNFSMLIQRTDAPEMHLGAGGIGAAGARVSATDPHAGGGGGRATRWPASSLDTHPQQHEQARHEHQNATRGAGEAQGRRGASGASSGPGLPARASPAQHS